MSAPPRPEDVTLRGRHVVLEPLRPEHAKALAAAVAPDDDVFALTSEAPRTVDDMRAWIGRRCANGAYAFAQRDAATGALFGSTSLFDVDFAHGRGEVGHTWIAASHRRTAANTEAKRLILGFAFETLGLRRVQLKTDGLNARSQRAIERIGGVREGVLRKHMVVQGGRVRDTVVYAIVDDEWPAVRARLDGMLDEGARKKA